MRVSFIQLYQQIRTSFWFLPTVMGIGALLASYLMIGLDETDTGRQISEWLPLPVLDVEGSRQILNTIAGSMISTASLVFSLVFVALTLISGQLGPRVLVIFMQDRTTQAMLGAFAASFLYSLMILGVIGTGEHQQFAPQLSVLSAIFLAVFAFGLVIYFIHHMAMSIQADSVIAWLGKDLNRAIENVLLEDRETGTADRALNDMQQELAAFEEDALPVRSDRSGYVGMIGYTEAAALARKHGVYIRFQVRPGHFVLKGVPLASVRPKNRKFVAVEAGIAECMSFSIKRGPEQNANFELNALVEVALRALSPGINDPFTAHTSIDHITDSLSRLIAGRFKPVAIRDEDGEPRVFRVAQTIDHYLDSALHPLRQNARSVPQVMRKLAEAIDEMANHVASEPARDSLLLHIAAMIEDTELYVETSIDHDVILTQLNATHAKLAAPGG